LQLLVTLFVKLQNAVIREFSNSSAERQPPAEWKRSGF